MLLSMTLPMRQAGINTLLATIHELTNEDLQHALQDAADLQKAIVDYANGTDKKDRSGNNDGGRSFQFVYSNELRLVHGQQLWRHVLYWEFPIKYS